MAAQPPTQYQFVAVLARLVPTLGQTTRATGTLDQPGGPDSSRNTGEVPSSTKCLESADPQGTVAGRP